MGPAVQPGPVGQEEGALPEAYGTGKLFLAARDPHCLYAHWDLTLDRQRRYNSLSADRHLVVRVYAGTTQARPEREVHVHPESRHWFVHVGHADTQYVAQLGYYRPGRKWESVATSSPVVTPADRPSAAHTVWYATVPANVRLAQLVELAKRTVPTDLPPGEAAQERALAELVGLHLLQEGWTPSAEVAAPPGGWSEQEISIAQSVLPSSLGGEWGGISSPMAPPEQSEAEFWFKVNAELVLYGATEPDATVTVDDWPVQLRPDGTFSCRLALPDGDHVVTVSALSPQGELRQAELKVSRRTHRRGEVGAAPEDPSLRPPGSRHP